MIAPPDIIETNAVEAAVIPLVVPRQDMPKVFGPAVQELLGALSSQGLAPQGAVFAHHLRMPPGRFDFEVGVPVAAPVKATGRVKPGALPAVRAATTVHSGPYEGLPEAWGAFERWLAENGHNGAPDLWEIYMQGPHTSPDPANWRTQLVRPLKR